MIFYSDKNVYEAAKDRIRWIFDEFPDRKIGVCFSGGKDSTCVLHIVKEVMDEKGIKKIPVMFLDQELEAPQVVEYTREVMHRDWVEPYWVQTDWREWNSSKGDWFNVWGVGEKWARDKEPDSIHDMQLDCKEHFKGVLASMFANILGENGVTIGGVRIEESPSRRTGLTTGEFYKNITWGKATRNKKLLNFYPIWDWSCNDVWYYIFSNNLKYCKLYNYWMTKKPLTHCRVSSFIHENSIQMLKEIKEVSPKFYNECLRRCSNVNTTVQTYETLLNYVQDLPPYFKDWEEYVYYLIDNIVEKEQSKKSMRNLFAYYMKRWRTKFGLWEEGIKKAERLIGYNSVRAILAEDNEFSKVDSAQMGLIKLYGENYERIKKANRDNPQWVEQSSSED